MGGTSLEPRKARMTPINSLPFVASVAAYEGTARHTSTSIELFHQRGLGHGGLVRRTGVEVEVRHRFFD